MLVVSRVAGRIMTNDIKKTEFIDRLKEVIGESKDSVKAFAEKCGVSEAQIHKYKRGEQEPGMRFFAAMKDKYPWVNIDWLITGHGEPTIDAIRENGHGNVIDIQHAEIIKDFDDKPTAKEMNMDLLVIEKTSKAAFREMGIYIKGAANAFRAASKDDLGEAGPAATEKKRVNG